MTMHPREDSPSPDEVVRALLDDVDYMAAFKLSMTSPDARQPMFFDLPRAKRSEHHINEHEVYYAVAINRGRRLIEQEYPQHPYGETPWADIEVDPHYQLGDGADEPFPYQDSIAEILQAAEYAGWDPVDIALRALESQRREKREAEQASEQRKGRVEGVPASSLRMTFRRGASP
jgi:hypothetical protein